MCATGGLAALLKEKELAHTVRVGWRPRATASIFSLFPVLPFVVCMIEFASFGFGSLILPVCALVGLLCRFEVCKLL